MPYDTLVVTIVDRKVVEVWPDNSIAENESLLGLSKLTVITRLGQDGWEPKITFPSQNPWSFEIVFQRQAK